MRTILLAAVLAAGALPAHADPTAWEFSYTGFLAAFDENSFEGSTHREELRPDIRLTGNFSGADKNSDGVIALAELDSFGFDGTDYFGCIAAPSPYLRCSIDSFSYALGDGVLSFSARTNGNDEFFSGWSSSVVSGDKTVDFSYRYPSGPFDTDSTTTLYWTADTRFSIVPAPVPEPAPAAMAAAGLLLLAGLRGRYRPSSIMRR